MNDKYKSYSQLKPFYLSNSFDRFFYIVFDIVSSEKFGIDRRSITNKGRIFMMKRTHVSLGLAATIPMILSHPIGVLGILGATAPDLDSMFGIKHRTYTHSLMALITSTLPLILINRWIGLVWFISYGLHLVADSCTKMGVPYFYPWIKKYYGPKKIKTRSAEDWFIQMLAMMFIVYVFLI